METLPPIDATVLPTGRYRHYKGNHYDVISLARHSETLEVLVIYRALYGEGGMWVRPLLMFLEHVEVGGSKIPRFTRSE